MSFENSNYLTLYKNSHGVDSLDQLERLCKKSTQFKYGTVNYRDYSTYVQSNDQEKKGSFYYGNRISITIIKITYHLALAILMTLPHLITGRPHCIKVRVFYIVRDFQEMYGNLALLFKIQKGQFHIEESNFQKTCYDITLNGYEYAREVSLSDFKEFSATEKTRLIKRFNLQNKLADLEQKGYDFNRFIETTDTHLLDALSLWNLHQPYEASPLKYALMSQENLFSLKVSDLESVNENQLNFLQYRVNFLIKKGISLQEIEQNTDFHNLPLISLHRINIKRIENSLEEVPPKVFAFFSNDQIKELSFEKVSKEQFSDCFRFLSNQEIKEKIATIEPGKLFAAIKSGIIDQIYILKNLSDQQIQAIDISQISIETLENLFCSSHDIDFNRRRFALLSAPSIQNFFEKIYQTLTIKQNAKICDSLIKYVSEEQILAFNFATLPQMVINRLFPNPDLESLRKVHSGYSFSGRYKNGEVTIQERWPCHYTEEQFEELSKTTQTNNDILFAKLTFSQQMDLEARLFQEDGSEDGFFDDIPFPFNFTNFGESTEINMISDDMTTKAECLSFLELPQNAPKEEIKVKLRHLFLNYHEDKIIRGEDESKDFFLIRKEEAKKIFLKALKSREILLSNSNSMV
ncbi:MAG: hypothetical protein Tsb0021_06020 [Chlamydiales bacterium]